MGSKDLTIGVLSTTAVILFVGLLIIQTRPAAVYASGMADRGGDYIMLAGELRADDELLYVIDSSLNRMITYRYDFNLRTIVARGGTELSQYFKPQPSTPRKGRRGSRRRP